MFEQIDHLVPGASQVRAKLIDLSAQQVPLGFKVRNLQLKLSAHVAIRARPLLELSELIAKIVEAFPFSKMACRELIPESA